MPIRMLWCICTAVMLTSCAPLQFPSGASTVEQAARAWVQRDSQGQAQTIDVKRVQMIGQGAVALATYDTVQNGRRQKMTALLFVTPSRVRLDILSWHIFVGGRGWRTSSGVRFARDAIQAPSPVHVFFASNSEDRYDVVGGLVTDPAVRRVAITYSNGIRRTTPVANGAYITAQSPRYTVLKVEALDAQDRVLYEGT